MPLNSSKADSRFSAISIVAIAHAVVTQDIAVVPEMLKDGGGFIWHVGSLHSIFNIFALLEILT